MFRSSQVDCLIEEGVLHCTVNQGNELDVNLVQRLSEIDSPLLFASYKLTQASDKTFDICFDIAGMVSLAEWLKTPLDEDSVRFLFLQIASLLEYCIKHELPLTYVDFTYDHCFYDPQTQSIRFLFLPLINAEPNFADLKGFFFGLPTLLQAADDNARNLLCCYKNYFSDVDSFNLLLFAKYLTEIAQLPQCFIGFDSDQAYRGEANEPTVVPSAGSAFGNRVVFDGPTSVKRLAGPAYLGSVTSSTTCLDPSILCRTEEFSSPDRLGLHSNLETRVLDQVDFSLFNEQCNIELSETHEEVCPPSTSAEEDSLAAGNKSASSSFIEASKTLPCPQHASVQASNQLSVESQGVIQSNNQTAAKQQVQKGCVCSCEQAEESEHGTVLLTAVASAFPAFALLRRSSGERVLLEGDHFVVGKSKYSSYQIKDTTTVSRSHAIFDASGDVCWIEDDNSLNGTFINEKRLPPHKRVALREGDVIRMSDETFVFEDLSYDREEC